MDVVCLKYEPPPSTYIGWQGGGALGEWTSSKPSTLLLVPPSISWVSNFTPSLSEPPLICHKEPTRGRWAREAPTFGRVAVLVGRPKSVAKRPQFRLVGYLLGPHVSYRWLGLSRCGLLWYLGLLWSIWGGMACSNWLMHFALDRGVCFLALVVCFLP